jgi:hypothetical protein
VLFAALIMLSDVSVAVSLPIELKYTGKNPLVLSDLSVFSQANQKGVETIVLVAGDKTDDTTIPSGGSVVRNTDKNGNALPAWKSFVASYTDATGEHIYRGTDLQTLSLFGLFTSEPPFALFVGLLAANINSAVAEDLSFSTVNGLAPALPLYFFSTTPFDFDEMGALVGGTGFTGTVTSIGNLQVSEVPEPITLLLVGATFTGLGLVNWRKRQRYV